MGKAIYPRYTREENKSCKLSQYEIDRIQELYIPKKFGMRKVAKELGLPQSTVRYWCISEEQRKDFNIMKRAYSKKPTREEIKKYNKDVRARKGKTFVEYESQLKKDYLEKPGIRAKKKRYMKTYRSKKTASNT